MFPFFVCIVVGLITICKASLLHDILDALGNAKDCPSCLELLVPVQALAFRGDDEYVDTVITICNLLKLVDPDVCVGALRQTGPIQAHALRNFNLTSKTAIMFCDSAFGLCQPPPVTPFTVPFPKPLPDHPKEFVSTGKPPIQVVHFSDVHIDRQYTVGADANCTKNICCRNYADHVGPITEPAGPFGNSRCDSPSVLAESMLKAITEFGSKAKFSIFTGDVVEGATWLVTKPEVTNDLKEWNAQMTAHVGSPVFGTLGNHDSIPVNSFTRDTTRTPLNSQWVYNIQGADWKQWINETAANELEHTSGSYAAVVPNTNLRILSINTQFWYKQNFWLYDTSNFPADPNGILSFMVRQLQAAEDAGQRVYIIGHIPSGKEDALQDQSNYLDQITQRYKNTIAAQFFGHSHKDQFEIAYSNWSNRNAETADSIAFIAPALTPTSGNPAFRVYDIDPDTYEVLDIKTYMTNTSDPKFQIEPKWELYYSARESYGPLVGHLGPFDALNASFWHKLTEVFEANETAFQEWNTRLSRGGAVVPCADSCKNISIADQRALRSENNGDAVTADPPFNVPFKRGLSMSGQEYLDCEGGGMSGIFRTLLSGAVTGKPGVSTEVKDWIRLLLSDGRESSV